MNKYYIYRINEYGKKEYFLGDGKFICWLASTCGATSFNDYIDALREVEHIANKENISITKLHIE